VAAWVKEADDFSFADIDAGDVRPLVSVAVEAGERQVASGGEAAVFPSDNVIDLERDAAEILVELAVFAAAPGAPPDELR
jgi:hypothetical protein